MEENHSRNYATKTINTSRRLKKRQPISRTGIISVEINYEIYNPTFQYKTLKRAVKRSAKLNCGLGDVLASINNELNDILPVIPFMPIREVLKSNSDSELINHRTVFDYFLNCSGDSDNSELHECNPSIQALISPYQRPISPSIAFKHKGKAEGCNNNASEDNKSLKDYLIKGLSSFAKDK